MFKFRKLGLVVSMEDCQRVKEERLMLGRPVWRRLIWARLELLEALKHWRWRYLLETNRRQKVRV